MASRDKIVLVWSLQYECIFTLLFLLSQSVNNVLEKEVDDPKIYMSFVLSESINRVSVQRRFAIYVNSDPMTEGGGGLTNS